MSLLKASAVSAIGAGIKLLFGLLLIKIIATLLGPTGLGLMGQFMSLTTILVLLAARLAKGSATGPEGLVRVAIAAGIMLAPPQSSVSVLMLQPDHVGSAVPVLLTTKSR